MVPPASRILTAFGWHAQIAVRPQEGREGGGLRRWEKGLGREGKGRAAAARDRDGGSGRERKEGSRSWDGMESVRDQES